MATINFGSNAFSAPVAVPDFNFVHLGSTSFTNLAATTSTTTPVAQLGQVFWSDGGTHNIAKIGLRIGAVTEGSGSTYRVSTQGWKLTDDGADGTPVGVYTSTTMPTANSWEVYTLSTKHTNVAHGAYLAVVADLSVFGASTSIAIQGWSWADAPDQLSPFCSSSSNGGTSWTASSSSRPTVYLESDDATPVVGTLFKSFPVTAVNTHTYANNSDPKEYATSFTVPSTGTYSCVGAWVKCDPTGSTSNFDVVLYSSDLSTVLHSESIDVSGFNNASTGIVQLDVLFDAPVSLSANTEYVLSVVPTSTATIAVYSYDVPSSTYFDVSPDMGSIAHRTKSSGDVWSDKVTTRRLWAGLYISNVTTANGGGGVSGIGAGGISGSGSVG